MMNEAFNLNLKIHYVAEKVRKTLLDVIFFDDDVKNIPDALWTAKSVRG